MAAGFDTTSGAAAWLVLELGRNPDAFAAVRAEVYEVVGDRPPTIDNPRAMPPTPSAVNEVLRLLPPGPTAPPMSHAPSAAHWMKLPTRPTALSSASVTADHHTITY